LSTALGYISAWSRFVWCYEKCNPIITDIAFCALDRDHVQHNLSGCFHTNLGDNILPIDNTVVDDRISPLMVNFLKLAI
jgi:hypothetical protein